MLAENLRASPAHHRIAVEGRTCRCRTVGSDPRLLSTKRDAWPHPHGCWSLRPASEEEMTFSGREQRTAGAGTEPMTVGCFMGEVVFFCLARAVCNRHAARTERRRQGSVSLVVKVSVDRAARLFLAVTLTRSGAREYGELELAPVRARGHAGDALEQAAEGCRVLVPDRVADCVDRL